MAVEMIGSDSKAYFLSVYFFAVFRMANVVVVSQVPSFRHKMKCIRIEPIFRCLYECTNMKFAVTEVDQSVRIP